MMTRSLLSKFVIRSIIVLTISILVIEGVTYNRMSSTIKQLTLERAELQANHFAHDIQSSVEALLSDINLIVNLESSKSYFLNLNYGLVPEAMNLLEFLNTFAGQLQQRVPQYENIAMCSLEGELLAQNLSPKGKEKQYVYKHCSDAELVSFKVVHDSHQNWYIVARKPVERSNQTLGFIEISMSMTEIIQMIETQNIYNSGFYTITDLNQKKLVVSAVGKQSPIHVNHSDTELITTRAKVPLIQWEIKGYIAEDEIFAGLNEMARITLLSIFIVLIIEILFLFSFIKQIVIKPLSRLIEGTKKFNEGQLDYRIQQVSNDELGILTRSFNEMGGYVENQINKLNEKKQQLQHSEERLLYILNNTSAIVCIKDVDGKYTFVNNAYQRLVGLNYQDIIGKSDSELFSEDIAKGYRQNDNKVIYEKKVYRFEEKAYNVDGQLEYHIAVKIPLFDINGDVYGVCNIATDITDMKLAQQALSESHQQLRLIAAIFESSREGFVILDYDFKIVDLNPAITELFGYEMNELIGKDPSIFNSNAHDESFHINLREDIRNHGYWHGEIWEQTKSGEVFPQMLSIFSVCDENDQVTHYAAIYSDISELKTTQANLEKLAHYDPLTGLSNRLLLHERVSQCIKSNKRNNSQFALMFIDLDNFKYINDSLGHKVGDELLKQLAKRISGLIRENDTVARLGGDEFVVVLTDVQSKDTIIHFVQKLQELLTKVFEIAGNELFVTSSIGISLYPEDGISYDHLLQTADTAMYEAKNKGKNTYQFYCEALNIAAKERLVYESKLRTALDYKEFFILYQPIIDVNTDKIVKAEALLRWKTREGEIVSPLSFIPILEDIGLITSVGDWIVEQVISDINQMDKMLEGDKRIKLNINLSPVQFRDKMLGKRLGDIAEKHHVDIDRIEFEVTESALMEDYQQAQRIVRKLKDCGFTVALDDFGTGFSSLSYLKYFAFDSLKLDRAFIKDIETNRVDETIVKSVIEMAQALNIDIVCEGIETKSQLKYLEKYEGLMVQGFYFSKPREIDELIEFIDHYVSHSDS